MTEHLETLKSYQDTLIDINKTIDEEMRILNNTIEWLSIDLEIASRVNHPMEEKYIRNNLEPRIESYNFLLKIKKRLELWQKTT